MWRARRARAGQRRLATRSLPDARPHRRHAAGARRARPGAGKLPQQPRDRRGAGRARSRQCRLAARSFGGARAPGRDAGAPGRPRWRAGEPARRARDRGGVGAARARAARMAMGPLGQSRPPGRCHAGQGQGGRGDGLLPARAGDRARRWPAVEPARTAWQRDLAVSYHKLGSLEALAGNDSEARELLEHGRAIVARLDRIAAYQAQWRADLAKFDEALSRLAW